MRVPILTLVVRPLKMTILWSLTTVLSSVHARPQAACSLRAPVYSPLTAPPRRLAGEKTPHPALATQ
eukprot:9321821-Alexandrium_andersonii.AAC.1